MKRKIAIVGLIVILLVILILVFRSCKKEYNSFVYPNTIAVHNYTNNKKADTISMIILNKIMLFDTVTVNLYKLTNMFDTNDILIVAHTIKNPFEKHAYNIFLKDDLSYDMLKSVLSHEMIHVKQMENGDLVIIDKSYIWEKDTFRYVNVEYTKRIQEIQAENEQSGVKQQMEKLYEKFSVVNPLK